MLERRTTMKPTNLKLVVPCEAVIREIVNARSPITQEEMERFVDEVAAFITNDLHTIVVGCAGFWAYDTSVHDPSHIFMNGNGDLIRYTYNLDRMEDIGTNTFVIDTNNGVRRAESLVNLLQQYASQKGFQHVELRPWTLRLV